VSNGKAKSELSMKLPKISAPHSKSLKSLSFTFGSTSSVPFDELTEKSSETMTALQAKSHGTIQNNHKRVRKKRIPSGLVTDNVPPEERFYRATVTVQSTVQRHAPKTTSIFSRNKFRLSNVDGVERAEVL